MKQSLLPRTLGCLCVLYNTLFIPRASARGRGVWKTRLRISGSALCVYVLKGVSVITWLTAHETEKLCTPGVTAEGAEQHLYVYIIRVLKWHCDIWCVGVFFCIEVRRNLANLVVSHVACDVGLRVFPTMPVSLFFFISMGSQKQTKTHQRCWRASHQFYSLLPPPVFPSVPPQDTRSPTVWTAGTRSAGPRWRWAPTVGSSPSRVFLLSRRTCSDSSLARLWAGENNWRRWLLPQSVEVSLMLPSRVSSSFHSFLI